MLQRASVYRDFYPKSTSSILLAVAKGMPKWEQSILM